MRPSAWASMTSLTVASWARKPSRRCTSATRSAVSSRLTTQSQALSPPPMMTTRLPSNSLLEPTR